MQAMMSVKKNESKFFCRFSGWIVDGSPVHYASTVVHVLYSTRIGGPGAVSG